jgi:hypothetical protein
MRREERTINIRSMSRKNGRIILKWIKNGVYERPVLIIWLR